MELIHVYIIDLYIQIERLGRESLLSVHMFVESVLSGLFDVIFWCSPKSFKSRLNECGS